MVRVFINHVDSYTGRALCKVVGGAIVGSTLEREGEEEGEEVTAIADVGTYEVVGTLSQSDARKPDSVTTVIPSGDHDELLAVLLDCDIIVYHMTESTGQVEEAEWAAQAIHGQLSAFTAQKVFICISSVMTWARSKPLDPDEPEVPLMEEDYRRRKNHPNYHNHIAVEKLVTKLGKTDKTKLSSYVVAAGLTYGEGEGLFHHLFKAAWTGDHFLPVFGEGDNVVPTIHVLDLAAIILNLVDSRHKSRYILALDDSHSTLTELVEAISRHLGTGRTKRVPREEALLYRDISQLEFDQLQVNLHMEAGAAKETMKIDWKSEAGLVENIVSVIKEYKESRGLLPIRACILGPPTSGKTLYISQLCEHYKLHHIKIEAVIKGAIQEQESLVARVDEPSTEDDGETDALAQEAQELLDLLKEDTESNNGRYSEQYVLQFYKSKLLSMPCQNQGFILDGFPKTYEQAKQLFAPEDGDDEDGLGFDDTTDTKAPYNKIIMPEVVVCLDASDSFLKQRVMHLPQSQVEGTHNTEEGLIRRLKLYREQNEVDVTVLNYFDELEIHPEHISVEGDTVIVGRVKEILGEPRNYGLSPEERAEAARRQQQEEEAAELMSRAERTRQEQEEACQRARRESEWEAQLVLVQAEEQEMLETQSTPLRNYLMQHVMPTLTQGLIQVCKVKPDDAVDYLAEYLFKHNPQID